MSSKLSWITSQYYYKGTCMRSAPARPVRACFVRSCCNVVVQEHDLRASPVQCNVKQALSSHITLHPSHFTSELFSSGFMSSHMSATFFLAIFMSSERSSNFRTTKHNRTTRNGVANCSSKTGSRRQSRKKTILKHFLKWCLKGKLLTPKLRKSADKSLWQPGCSHSNTIYDLQLQKTIVLRIQPRHRATLTQPLQYVSQHPVANLHLSTHVATSNHDNEAAIPMQSATRDSRNA